MSKKLLLADDSVVIQKLVGLSFANESMEIVSTDNGDDALAVARELRPDLVLADVVMPGLNGYEVCEAIKQDPALAGTPVLLLTGTFEAFDDARATAAGANGQITKPFEAQALVGRVNEVIAEAAAAAAPPAIEEAAIVEQMAPPELESEIPPIAQPLSASTSSSAASSDPFERPAIEEARLEPLHAARPVDLDAALDAFPIEGESTILDTTDDVNATPSPNLSTLTDEAPHGGFENLTTHVPSNDLDQGGVFEPNTDVTGDTPAPPEAVVFAELDDALESEPLAAPDFGTPPPRDPFDLAPDATVVQNLTTEDPLGLAPASVTGDSIDFAFDVSEQVPVPQDGNEDSFSSLMDLSESAILGGTESLLTADTADPVDAAPEPGADTIVAGFDVSSSDLATAPTAEDEWTPEPLVEVPDLSDAYPPVAQAEAAIETPLDSPVTGSDDLFDDLATGSPLDELLPLATDEADLSFADGEPLDVGEDLLAADFAPELEVDLAAVLDGGGAEAPAELPTIEPEPIAVEAEEEAPVDFAIGTSPSAAPDARVADLSPMVERRIQETLEKVAWEAFSDLSETIVKQVIGRVEQIAWEVIPEMAETLVREEIRKMKGRED
ncbi:MAG: response regulator [Myxococcota bacterium]